MSVEDLTGGQTRESLCLGIVEQVAAINGVSSHELDPLYSVIDPDALNSLFTDEFGEGHIQFSFEGCTVVVESSGEVTVTDSVVQ